MSSKALTLQSMASQYAGKYNLLLPRVEVGSLPVGTQLAVRVVTVDTAERSGDVYRVEGNKLGLSKSALNRIAMAAGITWVSVRRIDDRTHPHYCECEARASATDFDGTVRESIGIKTIDLRSDAGEGIPGKDAASMSDRQLPQARKFISGVCASKAMNRAIANILSIRRAYTAQELERPFVVPKLVPDTSNPVAQRAVLSQMLGATQMLYGPPPEETMVDAELEADPVALPPHEPAAADEPIGADDSAPVGEPPPEPDAPARVAAMWRTCKAAGMQPDEWKSLYRRSCGAKPHAELTESDLCGLELAVEAQAGGVP